MILTSEIRERLLAASKRESEYSDWDSQSHDRLVLALDNTPDGTEVPVADLSDVDSPEKELALDDLGYICLVVDYHGID